MTQKANKNDGAKVTLDVAQMKSGFHFGLGEGAINAGRIDDAAFIQHHIIVCLVQDPGREDDIRIDPRHGQSQDHVRAFDQDPFVEELAVDSGHGQAGLAEMDEVTSFVQSVARTGAAIP